MRKTIIFILILGISLGVAGFYYYQKNTYSREVLKLEILGPDQSPAFEEVEYLVKYKNNGNIVLEEPELIFQYPANSLPSGENSSRVTKPLEDIYPGEERTMSFKTRLQGKEEEAKKAEAVLRFRPKNLKAFYESKTTFTTKITFVPLTFELDIPSKMEQGRETQFFINYFSNSAWPLSNLMIKIEYPSGFEFVESRPQALEKTEWSIPILNKTEGGRIEIKGKLAGEAKEQKIFKATLGIWQEGELIQLKESIKGVEIIKSSVSIFQQINGDPEYAARPGDLLHYEIFFRNIGEEPFQDLFLVARLEGRAFDFDTLRTESGQFNRGDNSILWDWREVPKLKFLGQADEGKVEFWINLKKDLGQASAQDKNFALKNVILLSQIRQEVETKVSSRLEVSQKAYFQDEVFGNTGPLPPKVGENTTYTILWQAKNYYNDVKNIKVRMILPVQLRLTGEIFPQDARLTFDSQSREIVWEVGDLGAGAGVFNQPPNVSFQVSLIPSVDQRGQAPAIAREARISGEDTWVGKILDSSSSAIDTTLPDDPSVDASKGTVQ